MLISCVFLYVSVGVYFDKLFKLSLLYIHSLFYWKNLPAIEGCKQNKELQLKTCIFVTVQVYIFGRHTAQWIRLSFFSS